MIAVSLVLYLGVLRLYLVLALLSAPIIHLGFSLPLGWDEYKKGPA